MIRMVVESVIEPAMSECVRSVIFGSINDRKLRFYVDYRKLNAMILWDTHPWPRTDECSDFLRDAAIFSAVGCYGGNWQTEVLETDRDKTTFSIQDGLFRVIRMSFGL